MNGGTARAVSAGALNRTTLARQMLLERRELTAVAAIRRLGGLQAQEPASPYLALWTRLASFRPEDLDDAFARGKVVKATLMRQTLHVVTAWDYPAFWAAVSPRRAVAATVNWSGLGMSDRDVDELVEDALTYATEARTNREMAEHLADRAAPLTTRDWWWAIRRFAPFVHAPTPEPWSFGRRPGHIAARSVIDMPAVDPVDGLDALVRRYLGAFGPATVGDIAQFARLARARTRAAVARLQPELRVLRGPDGRELLDIADAELEPARTHAPVRFLPMWDSVLLAYENRSRVIPDDIRRVVIRNNGDVLPTFLVDGRVAGVWRTEQAGGRTRVTWRSFGDVSSRRRAEIMREASELASFVEPFEPEVYRRFGRWWSDPAIASAEGGTTDART